MISVLEGGPCREDAALFRGAGQSTFSQAPNVQ
jgi:hypothetical protein